MAKRFTHYTPNGELLTKNEDGQVQLMPTMCLDNLMGVTLPDGTQIDYLIMIAKNRRIGKKVNGILVQAWLYQDGLNPVAELDGNGNVVSRFVYGTHTHVPDYMVRDGLIYHFIRHLGSVRFVIDTQTGAVAQRLDYDDLRSGVRRYKFRLSDVWVCRWAI